MFKYLMLAGLALFLPGACALGYSLLEGPSAWMLDSRTFWGTPVSLFVFWIGLAHAGTLLSAVFLALDIKLDRRTALIAELSTLASLVFAGIFPLMHLGHLENFYMVAPLLDARGNFSNVRSPLVWDFCCIAVYALLSLIFFVTHLESRVHPALEKYRKPMAWLLFPLVLWVHTVVSLDFATTFVPEWRGAFFPIYFIAGAIFSGIALVNLLLCAEGYRVRLLERLQLVCSWILCAIWFWDFLLKGTFFASAFVLAGVLPQLRMVSVFRENRWGRASLSVCVLLGMFLERVYLVSPEYGAPMSSSFGLVDMGLAAFSVGGFMLLFFGARRLLNRYAENAGAYFGEVDGSDMAKVEEAEDAERQAASGLGFKKTKKGFYIQPWSSEEFRVLRFPLQVGLAVALIFMVWSWGQLPFVNVELSIANEIPLLYPIVSLVTVLVLLVRASIEKDLVLHRREKSLGCVLLVLAGACMGAFFAGGASERTLDLLGAEPLAQKNPVERYILEMGDRAQSGLENVDLDGARLLWRARCSQCHGADGKFNEKFVREYYPVPQKMSLDRLDSLGNDSLVRVVMNGRNNMNAYANRLTPQEAYGLVHYMRTLAAQNPVQGSYPMDSGAREEHR